ncbi:hypothetical protein [Salinispora arenicola]|uniref:hypothetical protein n=1 Tax=Salinispora arenicola TaxID=168697 RepID=UPI00036EF63C|nr:hypothetical protein [Salinispora arenicola]
MSLGALLPPLEHRGQVASLPGTEFNSGPAEFEFGWLLGEVLERALVVAGTDASPILAHDEFACGLPCGHEALDPALLGRVMVLHVVTHLYTLAAYMLWSDQVTDYANARCLPTRRTCLSILGVRVAG